MMMMASVSRGAMAVLC